KARSSKPARAGRPRDLRGGCALAANIVPQGKLRIESVHPLEKPMRRPSACLFTHVPDAACRLGATAIMIAAIANSVEGAMCVSASVQAPARTSPALIRNLQVEVASIWKPYDLDVRWNTTDRCALDV